MAEENFHIVTLHDNFYRDSFRKVILIITSILLAIACLIAISVYLYLHKPVPTTFPVDTDWRVQSPVPVNQPYLSEPDLLQWVSDTLQKVFVFDFYHYNDQLKAMQQYFTPDGWTVFLNQLNSYVNANDIQTGKKFVNATPAGAPYILQQGLLAGRYGWWVQMPIDINFNTADQSSQKNLTLQILVVRVPTLDNLSGVSIDNIIVAKNTGD